MWCSTRWQGSQSQPSHSTLQQMPSTPPSSLKAWQNAVMILLHTDGNMSDIKNYRAISLLPIINKVFSHILLQQILQTLDFYQPRGQAGFRAGLSMIDHLHVVNQLQEKSTGVQHPTVLCICGLMRKLLTASS